MERPYTLFIYSLKVIPNTQLEKAMKERGIDLDEIDGSGAEGRITVKDVRELLEA